MSVSEAPPRRFSEMPLDRIVDAVLAGGHKTLEYAETLPGPAYVSDAFYQLEIEKIFRKDWIGVGHVSQIPNVGDYFTVDLLGELLVVVRGPDRIRVMSRVCLHRWAPVVEGSGNARLFSCPFHKWGYALDGQLLGAPFMERAASFDTKSCRLPEIRTEIVESLGIIFISFSDTVGSIGERLEEMSERLRNWKINELVAVWPKTMEADFNWKIQLETGQECYHHFAAHVDTFEVHYPSRLSWCEPSRPAWSVCHSPPRKDATDEELTIGLPIFPDLTADERRVFDLYHMFPLTRLAVFTDRVRLGMLTPLGPKRISLKTIMLVRPEVAAQTELVHEKFTAFQTFLDKAGAEDNAIDVMQQAGAGSMFARPGRLSHLEAGVWHLAEYVRSRIAAND
jgi:nitrite reductase/ring-hydroxylating ferredoxin subunit